MTTTKTSLKRRKTAPVKARRTPATWDLRLYVAGQTARAIQAFANLTRICEEHLAGKYNIEVIDLLTSPQLAKGRPDRGRPHLGAEAARAGAQDHRGPLQHGEGPRGPRPAAAVLTWGGRSMRKKEDATAALARAATAQAQAHYLLKLYVAGVTPRSSSAIRSTHGALRDAPQGAIHVGDRRSSTEQPTLAAGDQIIAAPTLIKKLPLPLRRLIGDMANEDKILVGLDLRPKP